MKILRFGGATLLLFVGLACSKQPSGKPTTAPSVSPEKPSVEADAPSVNASATRGGQYRLAYYAYQSDDDGRKCYRLDDVNGLAALTFWAQLNAAKLERASALEADPAGANPQVLVADANGVLDYLAIFESVPADALGATPEGERVAAERIFTTDDMKTLHDIFATYGKPVDCGEWPVRG